MMPYPYDNESPTIAAALREADDSINHRTPTLRDQVLASYGGRAVYVIPGESPASGYSPGRLPVVRASGGNVMAPGSREAYERHAIPPIVHQMGLYSPLAYRTFTDPFGNMSVQPLVGGTTRYPHVLSGVPRNPHEVAWGLMSQIPMPMMPWMMPWMWGGMPQAQQQPAAGARTAGGGKTAKTAAPSQPAAPVAPPAEPALRLARTGYGDPMQSDMQFGSPDARRAAQDRSYTPLPAPPAAPVAPGYGPHTSMGPAPGPIDPAYAAARPTFPPAAPLFPSAAAVPDDDGMNIDIDVPWLEPALSAPTAIDVPLAPSPAPLAMPDPYDITYGAGPIYPRMTP